MTTLRLEMKIGLNMINKILIVEDKPEEAENARKTVLESGINDFRIVSTLSQALEYLPQYNAVLSDLFFPAGNYETRAFSQRILPFYEKFKEERFKEIEKDNIVLRAVKTCAEIFGVTPEKYISEIMSKLNTPPIIIRAARDSLAGMQDSEKYEQFLKMESDISNGINLPLGILVKEKAQELGKPSVIVTSTNHHNHAFEPVRSLIGLNYVDQLIDGKKDWKRGLESILA